MWVGAGRAFNRAKFSAAERIFLQDIFPIGLIAFVAQIVALNLCICVSMFVDYIFVVYM